MKSPTKLINIMAAVAVLFLFCEQASAATATQDRPQTVMQQLRDAAEGGKRMFCSYKGTRYEVVGIDESIVLMPVQKHYKDPISTNSIHTRKVFLRKGNAPFFSVPAKAITDVSPG